MKEEKMSFKKTLFKIVPQKMVKVLIENYKNHFWLTNGDLTSLRLSASILLELYSSVKPIPLSFSMGSSSPSSSTITLYILRENGFTALCKF